MRGLPALMIASSLVWSACAPPPALPAASPSRPAAPGEAPVAQERPTRPPAELAWARIADIPTPRSEVAATVFDGWIYVIGGFGGPNVVERYDPRTRRWERQPDLPLGVDHPMAASLTGPVPGVYVIGGNSAGQHSDRVFRLAPGASSWQEVARMPSPRSAGGAVGGWAVGAQGPEPPPRIYVVGGASARGLEPATLIYDASRNSWSSHAALPTPRDHLAVTWMDGRVCAVGGRLLAMSRNLAAFECYAPATDTWERLPAAPTARGGVGAAAPAAAGDERAEVVGGKWLFFIGGEQPQGTFKEVEIYDHGTRTWSRGPDLPTPRHGIGVVAFNNEIYVMTGGPTPGGSQTAVCEVLTVSAR